MVMVIALGWSAHLARRTQPARLGGSHQRRHGTPGHRDRAASPSPATPAPATPPPSAFSALCYGNRKTNAGRSRHAQNEPGRRRRRRTRRAPAIPHRLDHQRPRPPRPFPCSHSSATPPTACHSSVATWTASPSCSAATTANRSSNPARYPHSTHHSPGPPITAGNPKTRQAAKHATDEYERSPVGPRSDHPSGGAAERHVDLPGLAPE
jgi:hypothetical protein